MYNMDVGEHYYAPMTNYLEAERGTRGETPGALTFDERLSRSWLHGRRYEATEARERYARCSSAARDTETGGFMPSALRQARATSVDATASYAQASRAQSSATASRQQQVASSMSASRQQASSQQTSMKSSKVEETSVQQKQSSASATSVMEAIKLRQEARLTASKKVEASSKASAASASSGITIASHRSYWKAEDDVSKKIADIHITPFNKGQEMNDANAASARARARILELEKELEIITRKAMTTQVQALKTAKQMAAEAYADESNMTSSVKKSKKVMIESSAKVN